MGTGELRTKDVLVSRLSEEQLLHICAASLLTEKENLFIAGKTNLLTAVVLKTVKRKLFGLITEPLQKIRVIDLEGTIRLQVNNGIVESVQAKHVKNKIKEIIETLTSFGDAGALIPSIFLLISGKIVDLSGLIKESQIMALTELELAKVLSSDEVVIIASVKK
jgi:hypothetical protein